MQSLLEKPAQRDVENAAPNAACTATATSPTVAKAGEATPTASPACWEEDPERFDGMS